MLQYVADPAATLAAARRPLRPGGVLSVMAINRDSKVIQVLTRDLDPAAALGAPGGHDERLGTWMRAAG